MKKKFLALILSSLCLLSVNTVYGKTVNKADSTPTIKETKQPAELKSSIQAGYKGVSNTFNNMMLGYTTKDLNLIMSTIADLNNVVFFGSGARYILVGKENIKSAFKKDFDTIKDFKIYVPWLSISGKGDVAWLNAVVNMSLTTNDKVTKIDGRLSMVMEKFGKDWKIVSSHFSFPAMEAPEKTNSISQN